MDSCLNTQVIQCCVLQLKASQGENTLLKSYKTTTVNLEQDKKLLEQRVEQLELAVSEAQANANLMANIDTSGDTLLTKLKSEKEAADGQIEFLNSVIVDMQRKNEEMTARLQAMESGQVINCSTDYGYEEAE